MKNKIILIVAMLFFTAIQAQQTLITEPVTLEIGSIYKFKSNILNEERTLLIHLPENYENSEKEAKSLLKK